MLDQLPRIPIIARTWLRPQIHEVIRVTIALAHDLVLGVVQQGEELRVKARAALGAELVEEAPHARAQNRPPVVHVLSGWHPVNPALTGCRQEASRKGKRRVGKEGEGEGEVPESNGSVIRPNSGDNALIAVRRRDVS